MRKTFTLSALLIFFSVAAQTTGYLSLSNPNYSVSGDGVANSYVLPSQKVSAGVLTDYGLMAGIQLSNTNLHYSNSLYSYQGVGVSLGYNLHFGFFGTRLLAQVEYRTGGIQTYQGTVYPLETSPISLIIRPELYYRILQGNNPLDITLGYDLSLLDMDPGDATSYTYKGAVFGICVGFDNMLKRILSIERPSSSVMQ